MSGSDAAQSGNTGAKAGQGLGDAVKGVFNTVGGAGEAIRGNFNNFVDQAGEGLASQMGSKEEQAERQARLNNNSASGNKAGENADIAQKGTEQVQQGINQLTGHGSSNSTTSS